jgi:hypothetical protein
LARSPFAQNNPPAAPAASAYRADATILLLGIPILSRRGVGNGSAGYREQRAAETRRLNLSFAGGSWPERAAGVVKFGAMEEESRFAGGLFQEADYFGLITSSPEASYSEAREARDKAGGSVTLAAVEGVLRGASYRWRQTWFKPTGQVRTSAWQTLLPQGRTQLAALPLAPLSLPSGPASPPFLTAIVQCFERSEARQDVPFVYAGGSYRLILQREADPGTGASLARRIPSVNAARVLRFSGETRRDGKTRSKFRLWLDPTRPVPVPLRIEIQPRIFLRLSFELDPAAAEAPRAGLPGGIAC